MGSKPGSRRLRLLLALGAAIVVAYLGYLGSANWFLSSSAADRVINRKPEKLRLDWSRARSWFPGVVVLDDVKIAGSNRQFDWRAEIDHVLRSPRRWEAPRPGQRRADASLGRASPGASSSTASGSRTCARSRSDSHR
jgi:hypothetical protein